MLVVARWFVFWLSSVVGCRVVFGVLCSLLAACCMLPVVCYVLFVVCCLMCVA